MGDVYKKKKKGHVHDRLKYSFRDETVWEKGAKVTIRHHLQKCSKCDKQMRKWRSRL